MLILTSFAKSRLFPQAVPVSVCRWQPAGYGYAELACLAPITPDNLDLRSRPHLYPYRADGSPKPLAEFAAGLVTYRELLLESYLEQEAEICAWLDGVAEQQQPVALCCWCPFSHSAAAQLAAFGFFACHTGLIAQVVSRLRPQLPVLFDEDRARQLYLPWRQLPAAPSTAGLAAELAPPVILCP